MYCEGCGKKKKAETWCLLRNGVFVLIATKEDYMPRTLYLAEIQKLHYEGGQFTRICGDCVTRAFTETR